VSDQVSHPYKTISCYGCCMDTFIPTYSSPLFLPVLLFISAPILVPVVELLAVESYLNIVETTQMLPYVHVTRFFN